MHAASREALAVARAQLTEAVGSAVGAAVVDVAVVDTAAWEQLATQLRDDSALLVAEPRVRRALADPAQAPQQRIDLLADVLADRIQPAALRVLETVVRQRWSSAGDLLGAVELLAVDAELEAAAIGSARADGRDDTADHAELAEVEDELFRFHQIVAAHPQLLRVLSDVGVAAADRARLAARLLDGKARPVTTRLVVMALHGLGGRSFADGLLRLVELVAERQESQVAYVRSAAPLTAQQEARLTRHLGEVYGQQISLKVQVDPTVVGGAVIEVGDDRYDGSVARLLEQAKTALAS